MQAIYHIHLKYSFNIAKPDPYCHNRYQSYNMPTENHTVVLVTGAVSYISILTPTTFHIQSEKIIHTPEPGHRRRNHRNPRHRSHLPNPPDNLRLLSRRNRPQTVRTSQRHDQIHKTRHHIPNQRGNPPPRNRHPNKCSRVEYS